MVSLQVPSEACVSPVPSPVGSGWRRSWKALREGVQRAPGRGEGERGRKNRGSGVFRGLRPEAPLGDNGPLPAFPFLHESSLML